MVLLCFSGSFVALIVFHCPENKVMIPVPGICALYKRTIACCSPNCSMFQADCVPCAAQALSVPFSPWAYVGCHPCPLHLSQFALTQGLPSIYPSVRNFLFSKHQLYLVRMSLVAFITYRFMFYYS